MQTAGLYSDFGELANLRLGAQGQDAANRREVAGQFEALFVQMMVKAMRDATPKGELFNSSQLESYQSMYDQQLALELSNRGGIGLADVIMRQFEGLDSSSSPEPPTQFNPLPSERVPSLAINNVSAREFHSKVDGFNPVHRAANESLNGAADSDTSHADPTQRRSPLFASPQAFLDQLRPLAEEAAEKLGTDPDLLLAQAALETGWGGKVLQTATSGAQSSASSFNFFNIKAGSDWSGSSVTHTTLEFKDGISHREQSRFRAYGSAEESFRDYVEFVSNSPRYASAVSAADNPEAYIRELQSAGYATDPAYADKVLSIRTRIQEQTPVVDQAAPVTLALKESSQRSLTSSADD